jgi:predicted sulfurtransferase
MVADTQQSTKRLGYCHGGITAEHHNHFLGWNGIKEIHILSPIV